jgi:predicted small metal-binding protein
MAQDNRQTTSSGSSQSKSPGRESSSGSSGSGDLSFSCSDLGKSCSWQTRGKSEDEILRNAERHGREQHGMTNFDESTRNKVRGAIRREAA